MIGARVALAAACLALTLPAGGGAAGGGPGANASCVGTLVSFEAHIAPGFVGNEQQTAAPHSAGALGAEVRALAREHGGSLPACIGG